MRIGAHISISGGHEAAVRYAQEVGCECVQIFAKSPRQWRGKPQDPDAAERFRDLLANASIGPLYTHTAYLINLTTTNEELWEKSVVALADELSRAHLLGAAGVAMHLGNDPAGDVDAAALRAARGITEAFSMCDGRAARLLLENTAGAGSTYGSDARELGAVIRETGLPAEMLGICIDTCHAHAAGHDVSSAEGWDELMSSVDAQCGASRVGLVHANDCKFPRGEHKDRHEWIGDGHIGDNGFRFMFRHPALSEASVVLEMPGETPVKDSENIERLKVLRSG